jgi:hypothetical protein
METDRRSRSKVEVRIVGLCSIGWFQVLKDWGASIEGVVEDILDPLKDIRQLFTPMPTITVHQALLLEPVGPRDGCMFVNIPAPQDAKLFATLFG